MIYLKSIVAGFTGSILAGMIFTFVACIFALVFQGKPSGEVDSAVTWDLRTALGSPLFRWVYVLTVVVFFVLGFLLEFRRISR
jgi:hypothetical protein